MKWRFNYKIRDNCNTFFKHYMINFFNISFNKIKEQRLWASCVVKTFTKRLISSKPLITKHLLSITFKKVKHSFIIINMLFAQNTEHYVTFFRKNTNFLKTKYSKIRPWNKTIVLFTVLLNIIFLVELHSLYYNITLNFGFFVYLFYILLGVFSLKVHFPNK